MAQPTTPPEAPPFRRATPEDARTLARETFLADRRIDMHQLAEQLGVGRTTIHRWLGTREELIDAVLIELGNEFFDAALASCRGRRPQELVPELVRALVDSVVAAEPLRGFVTREPELGLRLLVGEGRAVRTTIAARLEAVLDAAEPERAGSSHEFCTTLTQVGTSMIWPALVAGDEPSGEQVAKVAMALLAAPRAT